LPLHSGGVKVIFADNIAGSEMIPVAVVEHPAASLIFTV
jgi:hypothetical protein